jgi:uncharacterized protein involved in tellurium resistance
VSAYTGQSETFLAKLFQKEAAVRDLKDKGHIVESALNEVHRQIQQALRGNFITGEGVTKSSEDD